MLLKKMIYVLACVLLSTESLVAKEVRDKANNVVVQNVNVTSENEGEDSSHRESTEAKQHSDFEQKILEDEVLESPTTSAD